MVYLCMGYIYAQYKVRGLQEKDKGDLSMLMNELLEKESHCVEYSCSVGAVNIPKERNLYTVLRRKYSNLAKEAVSQFSALYDSYTNCDDILRKSSSDFQKSICPVIDEIKKELISIERYDWDYDTIYQYANEHGYLNPFYEASDSVCDKIISVNEDLEAQKQYRQERKDNRARWEGGSFGGTVVDNYAHQAELGMMNIAEGIGHSIWNVGANSVSKMVANSELKQIFADTKTRTVIEKGVFEAAFALHHVLIKLISDARQETLWSIPSENDIATAQRLLNNIKSGAVPKEKVNQIYQEILALNPYNLELFENMLSVFGDESGELGTLADYYGVALQDSKDRQALRYVKDIQGETEEDSVKAKEKLIEYCGTLSLPVTDELDCMKYINQRLEDFDLQYRTVDGVVCSTRDSADFAREELQALQAFFGEIAPPTSESLLDYEADLLERRTEFEERFCSELKQKYLDKINGYLSDFDKKFCTTGLLRKVDRKQAGKDRLLKAMKKADTSSLEKIEEVRKSMEELLPKLGLVQEDTAEAVQYLEKQKDKILNPKSGMDMIKGLGKLFKK